MAGYDDLMVQTDGAGVARSYLASEAGFAFLKDLESRNLVVPVVGDFGGAKAIRSLGAYLKAHGATVAAFYLSNVEQYLNQDGKWQASAADGGGGGGGGATLATLPLDSRPCHPARAAGRALAEASCRVSVPWRSNPVLRALS